MGTVRCLKNSDDGQCAIFVWKATQPSQWMAMPMASAISSLVFVSMAFDAVAAVVRAANAFIASGELAARSPHRS